jgi:RNA polymerase sigma-70 factor (ECF subfamily)
MLRKSKNRRFVELEDDTAGELPAEETSFTDPLAYAQLKELRSLVQQTFNRMSGKQSEVVRLHDMEGNTIQEISEIIDCPVGTVKSRLFYGRQEFKAIYDSLVNGGSAAPLSSMN